MSSLPREDSAIVSNRTQTTTATAYGTTSSPQNTERTTTTTSNQKDPYTMRTSSQSLNDDNEDDDNSKKTFPLRRRRLTDHLSKWRLNARKKRSERSMLENFVIDWTLPIFTCYIGLSVFILMTDKNEPSFNGSFVKSLYFVCITIMAIGYGDFYPVSDGGKIYIMVLIFTGIVIIASVFDRLTMWFLFKAKDVRKTIEEKRGREIEEDLGTLRNAIVQSQKKKDGDDHMEPNLLKRGDLDQARSQVEEDVQKMRSQSLWYAVGMLFLVVVFGAATFHFIEGHTYLDSVYWAVVTTTTVGYGDIYPVTDAGRLFTCAYGLCSIGLVTYSLSLIAKNTLYQTLEDAAALETFELTAQTLIDIGGKKGYASEYDFLVAMLLAGGKIDAKDIDEIKQKFMLLDVNGDKQLDYRDLLGGSSFKEDFEPERDLKGTTPERKMRQ